MPSFAVLHVTSLPGGGVDRYIRDIGRSSARRHLAWHAADAADAIEALGEHRALAIDHQAIVERPDEMQAWLRSQGVGLVHAHSVALAPRTAAAWAAQALGLPTIVTLHDVLFLRPDGFTAGEATTPDPQWLRETSRFIAAARAVVAPSEFLAGIARRHLPGVPVEVIPNGSPERRHGIRVSTRPEFAARAHGPVVALLGAIGPHKGARILEQLAELLEGSDITLVVIGYLDNQIVPGWHRSRLFVHGAYQDEEVPALVEAYGAELGLFPNRVPESFSYTLSDLWAAGLPVIVPPTGALAERVSRHGGGWLLREGFDANDIGALLRRLLSREGHAEVARVKSRIVQTDRDRIPSLEAMSRSLEALYARYGIDPAAPPDAASAPVQELLAKSLDGSLFRQELVRIADEYVQLSEGLEVERTHAAAAREWMEKLGRDVASLQQELAREVQSRQAVENELFELRNEMARTREELRIANAALARLPGFLRRLLKNA